MNRSPDPADRQSRADDLLTDAELPAGFSYPRLLTRMVELGLVDLEPWEVLLGESLRRRLEGVRRRYPERELIPFARRGDRDDVACFDLQHCGRIAVIEDFEAPGMEQFERYDDLAAWLRVAVQDLIEFED